MQAQWSKNIQETSNLQSLQLPDWDVSIQNAIEYEYQGELAEHSAISFTLKFDRIKAKHVLHTYVPSVMLCSVVMFTGLIPAEKSSEKVAISVTTFLSMISLFGSAK